MPPTATPWSLPADAALARYRSGTEGLAPQEAAMRLASHGANSLDPAKKPAWPTLLARQFKSPLALILVFGALVSLLLGHWLDTGIIIAIVAGSALLSFSQEYRATRAVGALRKQLALRATVRRGGTETSIYAEDIVPGDIVLLAAGDLVPADGIVLKARDCLVAEASFTGESLPVEKSPGTLPADTPIARRSNTCYMGSSVASGTATLLVTETGARTEYGRIARRLHAAEPETDFARGVRHFGIMLVRVMFLIVLVVLTANQLLERPFVESLLFAVAIAVGMSPELLPAIVSVTLAAGARHLARSGVIVRRLDAVENLGSMDLLCTDKTGTLTEGKIRLDEAVDAAGTPSPEVMQAAFLNAAFETGIANPLDAALIAAGHERSLDTDGARKIDEIPYDFVRRRLSIVIADPATGGHRMITKGAYEETLAICDTVRRGHGDAPLDEEARAAIDRLFRERGEAGYRVLAVAERRFDARPRYEHADEQGMTLLGLLLFLDPPKADAAETIANLHALGIAVKVITGDNRHVAAHVAHAVGLDADRLLTGTELADMSAEALRQRAPRYTVFAEIDPQQKERIIGALRHAGHAVGYMGDGINDAPALHLADVGISVDQAVDVAREAADVVLLHRDLDVLRQGVIDGRRTFANTLKYIAITTSANFGNMVSMALVTPLLPFLPLLPKQILLNNFLSDVPSIAISTDRMDPEHLARPQRWNVREIQRLMIVFGLISSAFDLLTFLLLLAIHANAERFQTAWFVVSLLTEIAVLFVLRTRRSALASRPSRLLLWSALAMALAGIALPYLPIAQKMFGFVPIPGWLLAASLAIVLGYAVATEVAKRWVWRDAK